MDWTTIAASLAGILRAVEDGRVKGVGLINLRKSHKV